METNLMTNAVLFCSLWQKHYSQKQMPPKLILLNFGLNYPVPCKKKENLL